MKEEVAYKVNHKETQFKINKENWEGEEAVITVVSLDETTDPLAHAMFLPGWKDPFIVTPTDETEGIFRVTHPGWPNDYVLCRVYKMGLGYLAMSQGCEREGVFPWTAAAKVLANTIGF